MTAAVTVRLEYSTLGALDRLAESALAIEKIEAGLAAADACDFASPEEMATVRANSVERE
jgi:predicted transcriptional regulator